VRLDDKRPKWEHKYYVGGCDDRELRNALTFIPAELLDPTPWEVLNRELTDRFAYLGCRPAQIDLHIRSCRVVVNENLTDDQVAFLDAVEDANEDKERREKHQRARMLGEKEEADDGGSFSEAMGELLFGTIFELTWAATRTAGRELAHAVRLLPGKAGPPSRLDRNSYPQGITFELEGTAEITFVDGTQRTVEIRHADHNPGRLRACNESVERVASAGLAKAADDVVRQALDLPPILQPAYVPPVETGPPAVTSLEPLEVGSPAASSPEGRNRSSGVQSEIERLQQTEIERTTRISRGTIGR
jgi:hypothetical protein